MDTCPACFAWDMTGSKQLEKFYTDSFQALSNGCEDFFSDQPLALINTEPGERILSSAYLDGWIENIDKHLQEHSDCPCRDAAIAIREELSSEHRVDVLNYEFHHWLNNTVREQFQSHVDLPIASHTYICFDYQAPLFCMTSPRGIHFLANATCITKLRFPAPGGCGAVHGK